MNISIKLSKKVSVKFTDAGLKLMRSNLKAYKDNPSIENLLKKFETNHSKDKYSIISLVDLVYLLKHEVYNGNYVLIKNNEVIVDFGFMALIKNLFRRKKC